MKKMWWGEKRNVAEKWRRGEREMKGRREENKRGRKEGVTCPEGAS